MPIPNCLLIVCIGGWHSQVSWKSLYGSPSLKSKIVVLKKREDGGETDILNEKVFVSPGEF